MQYHVQVHQPQRPHTSCCQEEKSALRPRSGRIVTLRAGNSPEHLYNLRDNPSRWRGAELTSPVFIREASPRVESLEFCSLVLRTRAQFRLMISHVFRPLSSKLRLKYNSPRILWYGILPLKTDNIDLRAERSFHGIDCQIFPDALITDWKICLWETFCFIYEGYLELCWIWFIAAYQPQPRIRCDVSSPLIRITSLNLKLIGSKHLPLEKSPLRVAGRYRPNEHSRYGRGNKSSLIIFWSQPCEPKKISSRRRPWIYLNNIIVFLQVVSLYLTLMIVSFQHSVISNCILHC